MKIVLTATEKPLYEAWLKFCSKFDCVKIHEGSIFDVDCQAVVSPANSFGFMDGGIDWIYSQRFGWGLEAKLQKKIREDYDGELLVGQAVCIPTDEKQIKYLIAAPTMRVPQTLGNVTINPYLAAKAALRCAKKNPDIQVLAFPGLGTGVGKVNPVICAKQMSEAIDEVMYDNNLFPYNWGDAVYRHKSLYLNCDQESESD